MAPAFARFRQLAAVALVGPLLLVTAASVPRADAATSSVTYSAPVSVGSMADLTGVSCTATGACLAVDYSGAIYLLLGTKTTQIAKADGYLFAISCASLAFCVAVGNSAAVILTSTSSTVLPLNSGAKSEVHWESVSCPTPKFCVAGGGIIQGPHSGAGVVARWNGLFWSAVKVVDPVIPSQTHSFISSMSCINARFCVAADGNMRSLQWNGKKWFSPRLLNRPHVDDSFSISCTSLKFCLAVGNHPKDVDVWNGARWSASARSRIMKFVDGVSCVSPRLCVAVDEYGNAESWNGKVWSPRQLVDPQNFFDAISCGSAGGCEAVDANGRIVSITTGGQAAQLPATCVQLSCGTKIA